MAVRKPAPTRAKGAEGRGDGLTVPSYRDLKAGLAAGVVRNLEREGVLRRDDVRRIVADRTLDRRIAQGEPLPIEEADGILRLLRVRDHAGRVFEKPDLAEEWLRSPNPALDGEIPMVMAATDIGAREVEAVLTRIAHGVFG
jgi:putative toxin-antitoxin system antitoxin component (TIGR02293 family)